MPSLPVRFDLLHKDDVGISAACPPCMLLQYIAEEVDCMTPFASSALLNALTMEALKQMAGCVCLEKRLSMLPACSIRHSLPVAAL